MSSTTTLAIVAPIEHIVLIKVRPEAAASSAAAVMVSSLQALGPTHLLHSCYAAKLDLATYAAHPADVATVQAHVLPNALDTTVDWVNAAALPSSVTPGAAVQLTLAKVKEVVEVGQLAEKVAAATKAAGVAKGAVIGFGELVLDFIAALPVTLRRR